MHRILYVSPFAHSISGPDQSLLSYLRYCDRSKYEPWIALPRRRSIFWDLFEQAGATIIPMPIEAISRTTNPSHISRMLLNYKRSVQMLKDLILSEGVALVHSNIETVLSGARAAYLTQRPSVHHFRNITSSRPRWIYKALTTFIGRHSTYIIANSKAVADVVGSVIAREKIIVIPNSVDNTAYEDNEAVFDLRKELAIGEEYRILATIGRIDPRKGYNHLISMAALLKKKGHKFRLLFVGDAQTEMERRYQKELKAKIEAQGLNSEVLLLGYRADVPKILKAIDVFVFASLSEGFGRVVLEAMAAAKPVVSVAVGGVPELVEDKTTGFLLSIHDPSCFAKAVSHLLSNPTEAALMGQAGYRKAVERFSAAAVAKEIEKVYSILLKEN